MTWWLVHSRNVPRLTTCQNYITTHTTRRMTEDRYWTTISVNQWAYKTRFFKTGFCSKKTVDGAEIIRPLSCSLCALLVMVYNLLLAGKRTCSDRGLQFYIFGLVADGRLPYPFRRSFFFPISPSSFDSAIKLKNRTSVTQWWKGREGGRRTKRREEKERTEGRNIVKDIWDFPSYCLPCYLRLRTAAEQT